MRPRGVKVCAEQISLRIPWKNRPVNGTNTEKYHQISNTTRKNPIPANNQNNNTKKKRYKKKKTSWTLGVTSAPDPKSKSPGLCLLLWYCFACFCCIGFFVLALVGITFLYRNLALVQSASLLHKLKCLFQRDEYLAGVLFEFRKPYG